MLTINKSSQQASLPFRIQINLSLIQIWRRANVMLNEIDKGTDCVFFLGIQPEGEDD